MNLAGALKGKAPPERGFLIMGSMEWLAVVSVIVPMVDDHLSADFPAREVHRVHIHVAGILTDGTQSAGQVSGGNALRRRTGDVSRGNTAGERS